MTKLFKFVWRFFYSKPHFSRKLDIATLTEASFLFRFFKGTFTMNEMCVNWNKYIQIFHTYPLAFSCSNYILITQQQTRFIDFSVIKSSKFEGGRHFVNMFTWEARLRYAVSEMRWSFHQNSCRGNSGSFFLFLPSAWTLVYPPLVNNLRGNLERFTV